jgi:glycosyltransferase involved in cell wall biosynthesis
MRILMVSPVLGDSFGQERVMRVSSAQLRRAGHEVFFLGDYVKGAIPDNDGYALVPGLSGVHLLSSPGEAMRRHLAAMRFVNEVRPDVVHLIDQFDGRWQSQLCRRYPTMLTSHLMATTCPSSTRLIKDGGACEKRSGYACVWHHHRYGCLGHFKNDARRALAVTDYLLRRRSLSSIKVVGAISEYVRRALIADGWPAEKVRLVYNPIEVPQAVRPAEDAPTDPLILCVSRLEPYKGVHVLVEAAARITHLPWQLWIAGQGVGEAALRAQIVERGLSARVKLLGWVDGVRVHRLMKAARMVVQPNLGPEPFGLSVAEAGALGVPTVVSAVPALTEIVEDGVSGLWAKAGDAVALATQMERLLVDDTLQNALAWAAPLRIARYFSPERHLRATLEAYASCAPGTWGLTQRDASSIRESPSIECRP